VAKHQIPMHQVQAQVDGRQHRAGAQVEERHLVGQGVEGKHLDLASVMEEGRLDGQVLAEAKHRIHTRPASQVGGHLHQPDLCMGIHHKRRDHRE